MRKIPELRSVCTNQRPAASWCEACEDRPVDRNGIFCRTCYRTFAATITAFKECRLYLATSSSSQPPTMEESFTRAFERAGGSSAHFDRVAGATNRRFAMFIDEILDGWLLRDVPVSRVIAPITGILAGYSMSTDLDLSPDTIAMMLNDQRSATCPICNSEFPFATYGICLECSLSFVKEVGAASGWTGDLRPGDEFVWSPNRRTSTFGPISD